MAEYHHDRPKRTDYSNPVQVINLAELHEHFDKHDVTNQLGYAATHAENTTPLPSADIPVITKPMDRHERDRVVYPVAQHSEASPTHPDHNDDRTFASSKGYLGVADGVGGQRGSEQAAHIASNIMSNYAEFTHLCTSPSDAAVYLTEVLRGAHRAVDAHNKTRVAQNLSPLATTGTIAAVTKHNGHNYVSWATAGDSRLMVFRPENNVLHSLTLDDTAISAHKPHNNRILEQQALDSIRTIDDYNSLETHRQVSYNQRNKIAYALGNVMPEKVQAGYQQVASGDIVFAVSDAYTDNFTQDEIAQMIKEAIKTHSDTVDVHQITEYMNDKIQWFMRHHHETNSIRGKADDASIAMIEVA